MLPTEFGVRDELTDLAETFNGLLHRLREALQRERRFRADAAHNMFTPLTAIQSELDVTLRCSRSEEEYRDALHTVQRHTEPLSSLLDELMTLSASRRATTGPSRPSSTSADRFGTGFAGRDGPMQRRRRSSGRDAPELKRPSPPRT